MADDIAAALPNPGVSAWLSLNWRAKLVPGETVLILGATGVTGKLAVHIAKLLGAGRVIAAGRNEQILSVLHHLGAGATIRLDNQLSRGKRAHRLPGHHCDYVWGRPTEALLAAITRTEFAAVGTEARLVQVGESAGPIVSLPAAVLRSTALTILGTAGIPPPNILGEALQQIMAQAASGKLCSETEQVPLAEIEKAWERGQRSRIVIMP